MCKHCHYQKPKGFKIPSEIFESGSLYFLISTSYNRIGFIAYYSKDLDSYLSDPYLLVKKYTFDGSHKKIINDIMTHNRDIEREQEFQEKQKKKLERDKKHSKTKRSKLIINM